MKQIINQCCEVAGLTDKIEKAREQINSMVADSSVLSTEMMAATKQLRRLENLGLIETRKLLGKNLSALRSNMEGRAQQTFYVDSGIEEKLSTLQRQIGKIEQILASRNIYMDAYKAAGKPTKAETTENEDYWITGEWFSTKEYYVGVPKGAQVRAYNRTNNVVSSKYGGNRVHIKYNGKEFFVPADLLEPLDVRTEKEFMMEDVAKETSKLKKLSGISIFK